MGPMRFRAHLNAQGELTIDEALRDEALKVEIAVALRKAALEQLTNNWARVDAADRKRLAEQTNSDHASITINLRTGGTRHVRAGRRLSRPV
jgi:hypothetical protein